jgi:hypothetical protein
MGKLEFSGSCLTFSFITIKNCLWHYLSLVRASKGHVQLLQSIRKGNKVHRAQRMTPG